MLFQLEVGPDRIKYLEALAAETGKVSKTLLNRPVLRRDLQPFWEAYQFLAPSRVESEFGIQAIPIMEIVAYCSVMGWVGDYRERMVRFVRAMDLTVIEFKLDRHSRDNREAEEKQAKDMPRGPFPGPKKE